MSKYRLIALDMDGTLLNSALELTQGNIDAIDRAHAAGKHVVLCTGRCLSEIRGTLPKLPCVRYLVCENGSCVYDLKYSQALFSDILPACEVMYMLRILKNENVILQAFHDNQSYVAAADDGWMDSYHMSEYRATFKKSAVLDAKLFDTYDEKPFQVEKLNMYFYAAEDRRRIREVFENRPIKLVDSLDCLLEANSLTANKGRGLKKLCELLKIPMEETVAVGDSENDVEALRTAGFSAAMGNACTLAKQAADIVAPDCDHDGVAWVIDHVLLAK